MTKHTVKSPTWCDKCGHVIPREKLYYMINNKLLCEDCYQILKKKAGEK